MTEPNPPDLTALRLLAVGAPVGGLVAAGFAWIGVWPVALVIGVAIATFSVTVFFDHRAHMSLWQQCAALAGIFLIFAGALLASPL